MNCPGCDTAEMVVETYAGNYGVKVEIDVCHSCNGIWFDGRESLQLAPGSTLRLFKSMHERQAQARAAFGDHKPCPRCATPLRETTDQVRATKFSYFRCEDHGRFITFFQWLREKSLVRAPNAKELAALKAQVKFVNCSNCGAPVSLENETGCAHCGAPVSILASEQIEKTLQQLQAKEVDRTTFKPEKLVEAMMVKQQLEAQYRQQDMVDAFTRGSRRGFGSDLVGVGVGLLIGAIGAALFDS